MIANVSDISVADFKSKFPFIDDFFTTIDDGEISHTLSIAEWLDNITDDILQDKGMDKNQVIDYLSSLVMRIQKSQDKEEQKFKTLTIVGGHDKSGIYENVKFKICPGEIICIVGPTGSGKSRLLADIECLAQQDTPTGRLVMINDLCPSQEQRFTLEHKLVAQISQNMNFVVDLSVYDFITMHARSRLIKDVGDVTKQIIKTANELTGEKFSETVSVTQLSGGQSRALMIADTALLSASPVILIDEIENAGVDRKRALELLIKKEKIVLISTHDPLLAFLGNRRIVIRNGGIVKVIECCKQERMNLARLEEVDGKLMELRNRLRSGEVITEIPDF
jgi:ABC-type lipoprotein export system ATPase subunit